MTRAQVTSPSSTRHVDDLRDEGGAFYWQSPPLDIGAALPTTGCGIRRGVTLILVLAVAVAWAVFA